jgi:prepilin-type processing-associated H-X9-DG protein
MKQLGLGMMQYTQDYDERTPMTLASPLDGSQHNRALNFNDSGAAINWAAAIMPYVKSDQVYACPSAPPPGAAPDPYAAYPPTATSRCSYQGNAAVLGTLAVQSGKTTRVVSLAQIPDTAGIVMLQEFNEATSFAQLRPLTWIGGFNEYKGGGIGVRDYAFWHYYVSPSENYSNQHFDGGNLLFCDGHVKWRKYSSLSSGDFALKLTSNGTNVKWGTDDGGGPFVRTF